MRRWAGPATQVAAGSAGQRRVASTAAAPAAVPGASAAAEMVEQGWMLASVVATADTNALVAQG
jgi:hypothetical protein